MRIDSSLAQMIAKAALLDPYRQIDPMPTDEFERWLNDRGIHVGGWEALHHLWHIGVLHPVAVRDVASDGTQLPILETVPADRLVPIGEGWGGRVFADLGVEVVPEAPLHSSRRIPPKLQGSLLWHPFQLWTFDHLDRWALQLHYAWSLVLAGPDKHRRIKAEMWRMRLGQVREFGNESRHTVFLRVLALLLAAEPLVHSSVFPTVRRDPFDRRDLRGYLEWRAGQVGYHLLADAGLTIADAEEWHRELSFAAMVCDPVEHFRELLRHAERDERSRMKDSALRAHELYDAAEILRRYLARYHWHLLPEEPGITWPEDYSWVNLNRYGTARTTNYRRSVFRRIARRYGVDPGYRAYGYLEGSTEVDYFQRWAELVGANLDRAGVRLVNLRGLGTVSTEVFEDELRRLQEEEVFAIVCVDEDHLTRPAKQAEHLKRLREFEAKNLLPVNFTTWRPNFVQANFSVDEVVAIVNAEATRRGVSLALTIEAVEREMTTDAHGQPRGRPKTLEDAVDALAYLELRLNLVSKGKGWGRILAEWAGEHPAPVGIADEKGKRPIEKVFAILMRGGFADYELSAEQAAASRGQATGEPDANGCPST